MSVLHSERPWMTREVVWGRKAEATGATSSMTNTSRIELLLLLLHPSEFLCLDIVGAALCYRHADTMLHLDLQCNQALP